MRPVYCFGEVLVDFIPNKEGLYQTCAGGAPANVAVAVAKLGGISQFIGGISQDNMGQFLLDSLVENNVGTEYSILKSNKTALVLVTLDEGERSFDFYRDNTADMMLNEQDLSSVSLDSSKIVHFCSNTLATELMADVTYALLKRAQEAQACVSFDVNLRLNLWSVNKADNLKISNLIERCFEYCNIVKLSTEELAYLSEQSQKSKQAYLHFIQSFNVALIVVTDGVNPVYWYTQKHSGSVIPPNVTPLDTTAAGDSFVGGLLYKIQQEPSLTCVTAIPEKLSMVIEFAAKCAAYTVQHYGAFTALPEYQAVAACDY